MLSAGMVVSQAQISDPQAAHEGTINAIMDDLKKSTRLPEEAAARFGYRHPMVVDELSSSSVLTQTFLTGTTMGNCDVSDPLVRQKAIDAA